MENEDDPLFVESENGRSMRCAYCHRKLELGEDLLTVEAGVLGPRGVVPLESAQVFCTALCLLKHYSDIPSDGPVHLPRRVA